MTVSNRDPCIDKVLVHEGGYSNNPSDPGGPTNFGITLADARAYWKPKATAADVRSMPKSAAVDIYDAMYWDAQRCDELPSGVDYAVFDYGVNSGVGRAKKVLQRVVGVADDGDLGPLTMQAVAARDAAEIVAAICDERLAFLKSLKTWPVFGKGWASRVADVRRDSLALACRAVMPGETPPLATPVAARANESAAGKGVVPQSQALSAAVKGGTAGAAMAGAAASHAAIAAHPWSAAAIAAGILVAVVAVIWVIARNYESKQEAPTPESSPVAPSAPSAQSAG